MQLDLPLGTSEHLLKTLREAKDVATGKDDFRFCLPLIPAIQTAAMNIINLSENRQARFAGYTIQDQLSLLGPYQRLSDGWYKLNAESILKLRTYLVEYLGKLISAIEKKDYDVLLRASEEWFDNHHSLRKKMTPTQME